jgi:hypothetical protein
MYLQVPISAPAASSIEPFHSQHSDQARHELETVNAELKEVNEQLQNEVKLLHSCIPANILILFFICS